MNKTRDERQTTYSIDPSIRDDLEAMGHLELERPLLLGVDNVSALVLVFWGDDDFEDWKGCGADFFLLRWVE